MLWIKHSYTIEPAPRGDCYFWAEPSLLPKGVYLVSWYSGTLPTRGDSAKDAAARRLAATTEPRSYWGSEEPIHVTDGMYHHTFTVGEQGEIR